MLPGTGAAAIHLQIAEIAGWRSWPNRAHLFSGRGTCQNEPLDRCCAIPRLSSSHKSQWLPQRAASRLQSQHAFSPPVDFCRVAMRLLIVCALRAFFQSSRAKAAAFLRGAYLITSANHRLGRARNAGRAGWKRPADTWRQGQLLEWRPPDYGCDGTRAFRRAARIWRHSRIHRWPLWPRFPDHLAAY